MFNRRMLNDISCLNCMKNPPYKNFTPFFPKLVQSTSACLQNFRARGHVQGLSVVSECECEQPGDYMTYLQDRGWQV